MPELIFPLMMLFSKTMSIILVILFAARIILTKYIGNFAFATKILNLLDKPLLKKIGYPLFEVYKWNSAFLLIIFTPLGILFIFTYLLNLCSLWSLTKGQNKFDCIHPFRQYKLMFALVSETYSERYHDFEWGFWLLSMLLFFNFYPISVIGAITTILVIQLWPLLIMLELYVKKRKLSVENWRQYVPLILQLVTINIAGPILIFRIRKNSE